MNEFVSIQRLRAFAVLLVLGLHLIATLGLPRCESLNFGVDIFFCLSGCVMYLSTQHRPRGPVAALSFLRRRFIRVVPLWWFFLTLYIFEVYPGGTHFVRKQVPSSSRATH